jgi:uncharacterized membrane protein
VSQPPSYRPDAKIAVGSGTPADGTATAKVKRGKSVTFTIQIQNKGNAPDTFKVKGPGGGVYKSGTTDVTAQVKAGTYSTGTLAPDQRVTITVVITFSKSAKVGSSKSLTIVVTSTGDATKSDRVTAVAKAKK